MVDESTAYVRFNVGGQCGKEKNLPGIDVRAMFCSYTFRGEPRDHRNVCKTSSFARLLRQSTCPT